MKKIQLPKQKRAALYKNNWMENDQNYEQKTTTEIIFVKLKQRVFVLELKKLDSGTEEQAKEERTKRSIDVSERTSDYETKLITFSTELATEY